MDRKLIGFDVGKSLGREGYPPVLAVKQTLDNKVLVQTLVVKFGICLIDLTVQTVLESDIVFLQSLGDEIEDSRPVLFTLDVELRIGGELENLGPVGQDEAQKVTLSLGHDRVFLEAFQTAGRIS